MSRKPSIAGLRSKGFTLVELAVVLLILGLLLGGLLVPLSAQLDQQSIKETQRRLDEIREAIIGFALANGRLPCPATATIASGSAGAGIENRIATSPPPSQICGITEGVLPWTTLGVPETDAWGRRYTYRITASFADDIPLNTVTPPSECVVTPSQSSFALCSEGDIKICNSAPCNSSSTNAMADKIPTVILSHGKNGLGAYLPSGVQIAGVVGNESENSDTDEYFISQALDPNFDDIVVWIPSGILKTRMVAAGRLP